MDREVSLMLTEDLARDGARKYVLSHLDWKFAGCLAILLAYSLYALIADRLDFFAGGAFTVLSFAFGAFFFGYRNLKTIALKTLSRRGGDPAKLAFGDWGLRISSHGGDLKLEWSEVESVKRYQAIALVMFKGGGYLVIPNNCVENSVLSEIEVLVERGKKPDA